MSRIIERLRRATADGSATRYMRDVVGNKADAAAAGAVSATESLMAYAKQLVGASIGLAKTGTVLLTAGSVPNIFTIAGGPILVEALFAEITVVVSTNACATKLVMDPTAGADTDMCTTIDISDFIVNSFLTIDGTIGNAMINSVPATALPLGIGMDIPLILPVGTVDLNLANSNPSTGSSVWYMRYRPLAVGVTVTAVA